MTNPTTIPIETAQVALSRSVVLVVAWQARRTTPARSYVADGHDAVKAIDATLRALYVARAALVTELRADEIERAVRVDATIAEWQTTRYDREDPATGAPVPDHVHGYGLSGRESAV